MKSSKRKLRSNKILKRPQLNQISSRPSMRLSKLATTKETLILLWIVSRRPNKKPRLSKIKRTLVGSEIRLNHYKETIDNKWV